MTESIGAHEADETPTQDEALPFSFADLTAEDVTPPVETPYAPDPSKSKERPSPFRRNNSDGKSTRQRRRDEKAKTTTTRPRPNIPNRKGQFVEPLSQFYTLVGMTLYARDQVCGTAIMQSAESCAVALDDMAYKNDALRRMLWSLTRVGDVGKVIAAHMPIIIAIGMHHVPAMRGVLGPLAASGFTPQPADEPPVAENVA